MVKKDALMESLSSNLHGFLNQIQGDLSVPDKKFLRDGFIGMVRTGHPIVCQMAREVPSQGSKYTTRVKRLDLHLTAESDFDEQVKKSLPAIWVPLVGDAQVLPDEVDFMLYRLLTGLVHILNACFYLRRALL